MKNVYTFVVMIIIPVLILSQWSTDPTVNTPVNIEIGAQIYPFVCTDMKGGAIVTWQDKGTDVYAQRIDKYGYLKWEPTGVPICTAENTQEPIEIISDGYGGAIILWKDYRELPGVPTHISYSNTIYVQKVDSNGVVQWTTDGIQISDFRYTEEYGYTFATIYENMAPDQLGGVYVCWSIQDSLYDYVKYYQHVGNSGIKSYEMYGRELQKIGSTITVKTDNEYGIFMLIAGKYLSRFSITGEMIWDSVTTVETGREPVLVSDNNGGIFLAGYYSQSKKVQLNHVNENGQILSDTLSFYCRSPRTLRLESDKENGVYLFWVDNNNLVQYLVRVDYNGNVLWELSHDQLYPDVVDPYGNIMTFYSKQDSGFFVYVMKHDKMGNTVWPEDSVLFYSRGEYSTGFVGYWQGLSDGEGGAMLFWAEHDNLTGNYDIMAQLVNNEGGIGRPVSIIKEETTNPKTFILHQNYPNPFNNNTNIQYVLPKSSNVKLYIYNLTGCLVETLIDEYQEPGIYDIRWHANNVSSGIYILRIISNDFSNIKKMVLIK